MTTLYIAIGIFWSVFGAVWTWGAERRIRRLEAAEREREEAESSTRIRRPSTLEYKSLSKYGRHGS